jgi:predicted MPP superfamily phosphohydrolase
LQKLIRLLVFITLFTGFMAVMDLYAFRGIHHLFENLPQGISTFTLAYWGASLAMLGALVWTGTRFRKMRDPSLFFGVSLVIGIFLMLYIPKLLFNAVQLLGDLTHLVAGFFSTDPVISRKWFLFPGAVMGSMLFLAFGMGMARGRTNLKIFRKEIGIEGLPAAFHGLRIVQISDLHLAGFYNHPGYVKRIVERVNMLKPGLILFSGDMVHNFSEELDPFTAILKELNAPLGKFAILGNHDYGHYYGWESEKEKKENLDRVKEQIRNAGFDLLLNEHRTISLNGSALEIIGVENWGKPPFPQQGDLHRAMEGTDPDLVKILLSHDPSHWDLQVRGKEPIALTLSGHTHGMQLGFEIGNFRWSPSRWTYKHWAGLYHENGQYLYVNRGLGYTGFPGRVGIRPEITLLTLAAAPIPEASTVSPEP